MTSATALGPGLNPRSEAQAEADLLRRVAWRQGSVRRLLLDSAQLEASRAFNSSPDDFFALWGRRSGKSWWAVVECVALATEKPHQLIKYAAKTQASVVDIVEPLMRQVLESCPEDMRPTFDGQSKRWEFKNGSEIKAAGVDGKNYERLRGTGAHLVVKDEAAFWDSYDEADAVLSPQLLTTGGRTLDITTPPEGLGHPVVRRWHAALARGRGSKRTIWDNPRLSRVTIEAFLSKEADKRGQTLEEFEQSTYFRREYLCEFVTEESRAAVPGWNLERQQQLVIDVPRPKFFDGYVAFDVGFGDPHAVLFAWWDFAGNRLVVEDEIFLRQANTDEVAALVKQKEGLLWGVNKHDGTLLGAIDFKGLPDWLKPAAQAKGHGQPYLRVIDAPQIVVSDLWKRHGLLFCPTRKDQKNAAVDELDSLIRRGAIVINPRCQNLIKQLYSTTWNKARTEWERTEDGHGDAIDCLLYLIRNVRRHRDPVPLEFKVVDPWLKELSEANKATHKHKQLAAAFGKR